MRNYRHWPEKMYGQHSITGSDVFAEFKIAPHRDAVEYIRIDLILPITPKLSKEVLSALKIGLAAYDDNMLGHSKIRAVIEKLEEIKK